MKWDSTRFIAEFDSDKDYSDSRSQEVCLTNLEGEGLRGSNFARNIYCSFSAWSNKFKKDVAFKVQEVLPSPHSELVMGMVLGEDQFKFVPIFNDILKKVGLVHVVVVSGYNISLVFTLFMRILGSEYKFKNLISGLFVTFVYAGISGFGIPAVRAWIMGSIAATFKYYGRPAEGIKILIFSAIVILVIMPSQLFSISFQLSFLATFGVIAVPEALKDLYSRVGVSSLPTIIEDFNTSLSAQLLVNPIISYYFGTVSWVSLIANPLVLWVVPLCTVVGGALVIAIFISPLLSHLLALIIFPFLDFFVVFAEFFASFSSASQNLRLGFHGVLLYYLILIMTLKVVRIKKGHAVS